MIAAPRTPLLIVGDPAAAACEGDFCEVPAQVAAPATTQAQTSGRSEQALVNARLDADLV